MIGTRAWRGTLAVLALSCGAAGLPPAAAAEPGASALVAPLTPLEPAEAGERKSTIELAWFAPAASLDKRLSRTRRAALSAGVWNLDPAARAVLTGGFSGDALERTQVAVGLTPDLPAARMERARAVWLDAGSPVSALSIAVSALYAIPRHLEASLWFGGAALYVLAVALVLGGLLCIAAIRSRRSPPAGRVQKTPFDTPRARSSHHRCRGDAAARLSRARDGVVSSPPEASTKEVRPSPAEPRG